MLKKAAACDLFVCKCWILGYHFQSNFRSEGTCYLDNPSKILYAHFNAPRRGRKNLKCKGKIVMNNLGDDQVERNE